MKCKHQIDIGSETHNGCDNHAKMVLKTGIVDSHFCQHKCPYRVEVSEGLGDTITKALTAVGITKERVSAVVGSDCGCAGRQNALNAALPYHTVGAVDLSNSTRHLMYRVYPMQHNDSWQWNLQQLSRRWDVFNGQRVLAIGYDSKTIMPDAVLSYAAELGMQFDTVIRRRNKPDLREVETWVPMLEALNPAGADCDEIVFSGHSKGVRHEQGSEHIRWWAEAMYETCLDDIAAVQRALSTKLFAGSFRRFNAFQEPGNHVWHYSGTFYWFRLADIAKRDWRGVDQFFAGTESWPGRMAHRHEGACLFADNCGDLYDKAYWDASMYQQWQNARQKVTA